MATSQSLRQGQIPAPCYVCETETKISWKCLDCDLLMCNRCKDIIHPNIKDAKNHKVLDIKEVRLQAEGLDFSNILCKEHQGQVCAMFCKSCDQLVCPPCIPKVHKGHTLVEISEGYQIQVQKLKVGQGQTKINIDELTKGESKLKYIKKTEYDKYAEAREKIQAQNISSKKLVDQYREQLFHELDQKWLALKTCIEQDEKIADSKKKDRMDKNNQADEIINSNDMERTFDNAKELERVLKEAVKPLDPKFSFMPTFVAGDIRQYNVGSLHKTSTEITLELIKEYTTDICGVFVLTQCVDSLWISDQEVLQKVQLRDGKLKVKVSFDITVCSMAVTSSNDLLLATSESTKLKQISSSTNKLTDTHYNIGPLCLISHHITNDYKVVVGAKNFGDAFPATGRRVVISMDKEGENRTVYEYDRNNQRLFTYPEIITSTHSGNIFVVDILSKDDRGRVMVLGQKGDILNIYNGHPDINTKDNPFQPVSIVTTPSDNIIIPNLNIGILHILNNLGHLLTYINTRNFGIQRPLSLAVTNTGTVYIGCTVSRNSTDKAKLYEVKISGC